VTNILDKKLEGNTTVVHFMPYTKVLEFNSNDEIMGEFKRPEVKDSEIITIMKEVIPLQQDC
jgi:hypothetical protein